MGGNAAHDIGISIALEEGKPLKKANFINRKAAKVVIISLGVMLCFLVFMVVQDKKEYSISEKYSFSEIMGLDFKFDDEECENINTMLQSRVTEDERYFGFSGDGEKSIDLYKTNAVVESAKMLNNLNSEDLRARFSFLNKIDISQLEFLDLIYYINISEIIGLNVDYTDISKALEKFYDDSSRLFFIDSAEDSIHIKLIATAMCKKAVGEKLSEDLFDVENGLRIAYKDYEFKVNGNDTFYNAGADIIYCYSVFDMEDEIDMNSLGEWFEYWKEKNEAFEVVSVATALQYSEFLNIAEIFCGEYSDEKLYDYYVGMTEKNFDEVSDLYVFYNIFDNIKKCDNERVNAMFKNRINREIDSDSLYNLNIDLKSTFFGVVLAKKSGFSIERDKLNAYIADNYKNIDTIDDDYERITELYYNLMLEQEVNGYDIKYDKQLFQAQIDKTLKNAAYEENIGADIVSTRRALEILMDLQMFDVDIKISNAQARKIKDGVEAAVRKEEILYSSIACDLFIIDETLSLDILNGEKLHEVYDRLESGGGNMCMLQENVKPDIETTYRFFVCFDRTGDYDNIGEQKKFVEKQMIKPGIYRHDTGSSFCAFSDSLYGSAIKYLEIGGDKRD